MISRINKYIVSLLNLPEIIFIIIAFIFGSIFLFLTPPGCVPDEPCHMYRSCDVASGHLISEIRPEIRPYDDVLSKILAERFPNDNLHFAMRYSPVMYFAPAVGIKAGNMVFDNGLSIFYSGRFFSLLFYIVLIAAAIRITPVFKYPFMFTALLPMSLFLGMSYNADSFGIAFTFLLFAYLFRLMFSKEGINNKQSGILGFLSVTGALAKGLIYPVFLYFFLPIKKHKFKILFFLLFITFIAFYYSSNYLNFINTNHTCEVINDKSYILHYPVETLSAVIMTTKEKGYIYIQQLIGYLGWLSVPIPEAVCRRTIFVFCLMLLVLRENIKVNIKIFSGFLFLFFYFLILYMELITWTPVGKTIIEGVQGRYFIPLLPFVMLAFPSFKLNLGENWKYLFKAFIIFFIINLLYVSCLGLETYYYELNINNFM